MGQNKGLIVVIICTVCYSSNDKSSIQFVHRQSIKARAHVTSNSTHTSPSALVFYLFVRSFSDTKFSLNDENLIERISTHKNLIHSFSVQRKRTQCLAGRLQTRYLTYTTGESTHPSSFIMISYKLSVAKSE